MGSEDRIRYHLRELETARNPDSPDHVMPVFRATDRAILDIGCGIGQTLVAGAVSPGALLVGVDCDRLCLQYGRSHFGHVDFVNAAAENLPFADHTFDRVISRVSLPYTDIPKALKEIGRVLKPGGTIWLTLHPFSQQFRHLGRSIVRLRFKDVVLRSYVLANGLVFLCFGRVMKLPIHGSRESFQTKAAMERALRHAGFDDISARRVPQFIMTASKPGLLPAFADDVSGKVDPAQ